MSRERERKRERERERERGRMWHIIIVIAVVAFIIIFSFLFYRWVMPDNARIVCCYCCLLTILSLLYLMYLKIWWVFTLELRGDYKTPMKWSPYKWEIKSENNFVCYFLFVFFFVFLVETLAIRCIVCMYVRV